MEGDGRQFRIQARRDRVENRHVSAEDAATTEAEGKETAKAAARVAESLASLDAKKVNSGILRESRAFRRRGDALCGVFLTPGSFH